MIKYDYNHSYEHACKIIKCEGHIGIYETLCRTIRKLWLDKAIEYKHNDDFYTAEKTFKDWSFTNHRGLDSYDYLEKYGIIYDGIEIINKFGIPQVDITDKIKLKLYELVKELELEYLKHEDKVADEDEKRKFKQIEKTCELENRLYKKEAENKQETIEEYCNKNNIKKRKFIFW